MARRDGGQKRLWTKPLPGDRLCALNDVRAWGDEDSSECFAMTDAIGGAWGVFNVLARDAITTGDLLAGWVIHMSAHHACDTPGAFISHAVKSCDRDHEVSRISTVT